MDMATQRVDRLLASTGRWSRRESRQLIRQGRVLADGQSVRSGDSKYDPAETVLTVDGQVVELRLCTCVMMNKPAGVLSATEDGHGWKTVLDLLPAELRRMGLFPVGRLDADTTGLLLLTNDGDLAHALLSPKRHVEKEYHAETAGSLTEAAIRRFREGLLLSDGYRCLPAELEVLHAGERSTVLVTVHEGKYHQVKRMLAACGAPVLALQRIRIGNLTLDPALAPGDYRFLTEEEVEKGLRNIQ